MVSYTNRAKWLVMKYPDAIMTFQADMQEDGVVRLIVVSPTAMERGPNQREGHITWDLDLEEWNQLWNGDLALPQGWHIIHCLSCLPELDRNVIEIQIASRPEFTVANRCSVPNCLRKVQGRGLCQTHYNKQWQRPTKKCIIEGCVNVRYSRNLCRIHYREQYPPVRNTTREEFATLLRAFAEKKTYSVDGVIHNLPELEKQSLYGHK
jgi:hypothetical protein